MFVAKQEMTKNKFIEIQTQWILTDECLRVLEIIRQYTYNTNVAQI